MSKDTAVDWLINHFTKLQKQGEKMTWTQVIDIIKLAKEPEREQMIEFHVETMKIGLIGEGDIIWKEAYEPKIREVANYYYEQTYGGNNGK